ncbi:hypothetical protein MUP37_01525 [Candidatus Bathyarchaeota archaeon]|jgi:hypothetical protein|nr:hypothetical protein [Candidatus Bathyarchaeota archaeon]
MPDNATVEISGVRMNLAMNQKEFKTGSRGYFAQGKFEVNGKRYQVQVQAVEIGSKERKTA